MESALPLRSTLGTVETDILSVVELSFLKVVLLDSLERC